MEFVAHKDLKVAVDSKGLFSRWLDGGVPEALSRHPNSSAQDELEAALDCGALTKEKIAPFWQAVGNTAAGAQWAEQSGLDYPDLAEAQAFQIQLQQLVKGRAQVVITGQQPGFMGGPLYTLYKIATVIALAQDRTDKGCPTYPVFWAGEDDDDLVEAMSPVTWDPREGRLFQSDGSIKPYLARGQMRPCVGNLASRKFSSLSRQWLESMASLGPQNDLGQQLALLWGEAVDNDWNWGQLFRRFLLLAFRDHGLIIVSGNDPFLHETAAPLYQTISRQREQLSLLASRRSREIDDAGYPVPISDRSVHRHLFRTHKEGRVFFEPGETALPAADLRPGVLFRSPVQDWLFEPAAVVVGPGEWAYLNQLLPLYDQLKIFRSPLVPRMFAQIFPVGFSGDTTKPAVPDTQALAQQVAMNSRNEIMRVLHENLKVSIGRARELAGNRSRRLQKSLETLFHQEAEKVQLEKTSHLPGWIEPKGQRQERTLSAAGALALWGQPLVAAMLSGARSHMKLGRENAWQELQARVPDWPESPGER